MIQLLPRVRSTGFNFKIHLPRYQNLSCSVSWYFTNPPFFSICLYNYQEVQSLACFLLGTRFTFSEKACGLETWTFPPCYFSFSSFEISKKKKWNFYQKNIITCFYLLEPDDHNVNKSWIITIAPRLEPCVSYEFLLLSRRKLPFEDKAKIMASTKFHVIFRFPEK